jgi:DNA-directed RNA polymerase specialized sigma24 family protein
LNDQTLRYLVATEYALRVLGDDASRYFPRLHRLAEYNTTPELESIIRGWRPPNEVPPSPPAPNLWAAGSQWGSAVRVARDRGIFWKLRCACGQLFEVSTNDSIPECRRKCQNCLLADDLSAAKTQLVFKLEETAKIILKWYEDYGKLVWSRVHKACDKRGISDRNFAKELNALCWSKIAQVAGSYQDRGFKVSTWLTRIVDNCIRDHFKVKDNRERLAPTVPLVSEDGRDAAAPPTRPEEIVPAKPTRPEGADSHDAALNEQQANWDKAQNWNG